MPKLNILNVSERTGTEDSRAVSLSIKDIPVGEISVKANIRTEYDSLDELTTSIRQYGLLQPITVYKDGDAYHIKTGHRRFLAFKALYAESPDRYHSIRCIISDAENIPIIQLVENIQRLDLSQLDLFNALNALKEQGLSLKQIADMMGKSEKYDIKRIIGTDETVKLANIYTQNGIIPVKKQLDAHHIAIASVNNLDCIVSLNFKHINKLKTKSLVDAVNILKGYKNIVICTPMEVTDYETDE
jgi:ParB/RepB/Spo0J family partition protein